MTDPSLTLPRIRHATLADAAALAELGARTFHDTFAADNRPEDMAAHLASFYGPEQQLRELADPQMLTLVAEEGGALVAFVQLRRGAAPSCVTGEAPIEIQRFYVAAEWKGRGLAQALMARSLDEARAMGGITIWLGVWERNPRAIAFYAKMDTWTSVRTRSCSAPTRRSITSSRDPFEPLVGQREGRRNDTPST